jgi:hypothetical protein
MRAAAKRVIDAMREVRKLEAEEGGDITNKKTSRPASKVQQVQGGKATKRVSQDAIRHTE